MCVFKLLKLSFNSDDLNIVNGQLKRYGIFNLHHRLVSKLSIFVAKIFYFKNPPNLVDQLKFNSERKIPYNLRNQNKLTEPKALRKYGENTFGYFFSKFINNFLINQFNNFTCLNDFKSFVFKNLDNIVKKATIDFDKLNFYIKYFYFFCN